MCNVDGDRATGTAYCWAHELSHVESGNRDLTRLNWYADKYERTPEGWRIRSRAIYRRWQETIEPAS